MIAGLTVMLQCHLVTEDDNKTFSSDNEVFKWLVAVLDSAVCGKQYRGLEFPVIEVIEVISVSSQIFFLILNGVLSSFSVDTSFPKRHIYNVLIYVTHSMLLTHCQ